MIIPLVKRGFTEAKLAGDASYFKSKPCMLCGGHMYYVRGHRCSSCNPNPAGKTRNAKDNYCKDGPSIAGRYIPEQKRPWPVMQFEDAETNDEKGTYHRAYNSPLRYASSASDMAEG
jgi:ribosomal protein L37E